MTKHLAFTAAVLTAALLAAEAKAGGYERTRFSAPVYQPQQQFFAAPQQFGQSYSYERQVVRQSAGYQQQFSAPVYQQQFFAPVPDCNGRSRGRFGNGGCYNAVPVCPPVQTFGGPAYGRQRSFGFGFNVQRGRFGY